MPELPEVETVKETLKKRLIGQKIIGTKVLYDKIIEYPNLKIWEENIQNKIIKDISRRGKWLLFDLDDYVLLSHLRMEGKYFFRTNKEDYKKHEHIVFEFETFELRYADTRKFGRMHLLKKEELYKRKPLRELGLEPFDKELTGTYLKDKLKNKNIPIKTTLLDQQIIVGIGNIYVDEILFLSHIHPLKNACELTISNLEEVIDNTKKVLKKAIEEGGTTIRSYESSEGVHGRFQHCLLVHGKDICPNCKQKIEKIKVGGRGTYYCSNCQI